MQRPSKIRAFRRRLNSHEAAEPHKDPRLPRQARQRQLLRAQVGGSANNQKDEEPQYHIEPPHCVRGSGLQFVGLPHPAPPLLSLLMSGGGLNAWRATVAGAEREAPAAGHEE